MTLEENNIRYCKDPEYKQLVDGLINTIMQCRFTPQEMRDAAFFASLEFEMRYGSVCFNNKNKPD